MSLTIAIQKEVDHTAVITIAGHLSAMNVAQLRAAVMTAIDQQSNRIVLELSGIEFIDSSGLGEVISGLKRARQAGGDLRLVNPASQVMMILRLTNLDLILPVYASVDDATSDDAA